MMPIYKKINDLFQSSILHTDCGDGEILCPLGKIGRSGRIDTFGGRCINASFVCDGYQDCVGGTDEVNCGHGKTFNAVNLMVVVSGRMLVMYFDHISVFETL